MYNAKKISYPSLLIYFLFEVNEVKSLKSESSLLVPLVNEKCCSQCYFQNKKHATISELYFLHWLPVRLDIDFKILLLGFKALNGLTPKYISVLLPWLFLFPAIMRVLLFFFPGYSLWERDGALFSLSPAFNGIFCPFNLRQVLFMLIFPSNYSVSENI